MYKGPRDKDKGGKDGGWEVGGVGGGKWSQENGGNCI